MYLVVECGHCTYDHIRTSTRCPNLPSAFVWINPKTVDYKTQRKPLLINKSQLGTFAQHAFRDVRLRVIIVVINTQIKQICNKDNDV